VAWDTLVLTNQMTFGKVFAANEDANPAVVEQVIRNIHENAWNDIQNN
jgi:hypothetical protein